MPETFEPKIIYSQEAEEAVLGSALIDPGCIRSLDLAAEDFYIQRHRWIWQALLELSGRGVETDMVTLVDELERMGKLAEVGSAAYLSGLYISTPTSLHAEEYANIVQEKARRRALLAAANEMARGALNETRSLDDVILHAVQALTVSLQGRGAARPLSEYISALRRDVSERSMHPTQVFGLPTGLADFDRVTGGLQPGESLYIGGEPGVGKSILAVQIGIGMAQHGRPGAVYSLEMGGLQVARRIISALGKLETAKLKTGITLPEDWAVFSKACEMAAALPVWLSDESYWTTTSLRADLARLKINHAIEWFVLDYMYLLSDGVGKLDATERTELLSSRIKLLCRQFNLAGVTVNSVTKDGEDLRGSGQVKHDADTIVMLKEHQPDTSTFGIKYENMRTLVFKKGRELVNPRTYLHLVKQDTFPAFVGFAPEAETGKRGREKGKNGKVLGER